MADDEDMGTSFMRQHMSEAALSKEEGALKGPRPTATQGTDSYYAQKYGKGGDPDPGTTTVNRADKTSKRGGEIGTDAFYSSKYGGDGYGTGNKPKKSQKDKEIKY